MALSAELDQVLDELISNQRQTQELRSQVGSLQAEKNRLSAEVGTLNRDQQTVLQTLSTFHQAARKELQLSAAYSECLQALSNCKAQLLTTELDHQQKYQAVQDQLQLKSQEVESLTVDLAEQKDAAVQANRTHSQHMERLLAEHTKGTHTMQLELASLQGQLHQKTAECVAKSSNISMDQKTTNLLKSKLAIMRTEAMQLQRDRDQLRAQLMKS